MPHFCKSPHFSNILGDLLDKCLSRAIQYPLTSPIQMWSGSCTQLTVSRMPHFCTYILISAIFLRDLLEICLSRTIQHHLTSPSQLWLGSFHLDWVFHWISNDKSLSTIGLDCCREWSSKTQSLLRRWCWFALLKQISKWNMEIKPTSYLTTFEISSNFRILKIF